MALYREMRKKLFIIIAVSVTAVGLYMLASFVELLLVPYAPAPIQPEEVVAQDTQPNLSIPVLNLNEKLYFGGEEMLDQGVWMKFADRSNPEKGGNTVIVGHRFNMGLAPGMTKRKSPFYHIDKLEVGDSIYVSWLGKQYEYKVAEIKTVSPYAVEVEVDTEEPQLTLYTCTLGGAYDGRHVIIAHPLTQ
jgi:LPXTG-site transpeptidase (sortase) family protein